MNGKAKYTLIILLAIIIADVSAQNSQVLYYMNLPQNHFVNPALRPSNSLYIGLPVVSGINLNVNNNFVNFSDIFMKGQGSDSVFTFLHPDFNIEDFLAKIKDKNSLEPQMSIQLFGLGFSVGKNSYVFLDINERMEGNIVFPGDLFELALKGNEGFKGSKVDLSSFRGDLKYYREIGLGFSKNITNKLRIGVKGKLLFGIAAFSIDNRALALSINNDYTHTLDADLIVNISAPVSVTKDAAQKIESIEFDDSRFKTVSGTADFILGKKNMGLGLDIGATYDFSDKIVFSAAITDLGFIKWKNDVTNLQAKSQFEFSGLNITDVLDGTKTIDELGQDMVDSLTNSFNVSDSKDPFTTWIPFGISLGGSYKLSEKFSLGVLSYSRFIGKQLRESLTFSANVNLGNSLSTSLSYTAANHRFDNLGAGVSLRAGVFQFYMLADRIPVSWNQIKTDNGTIPIPANWNTINLRLGMNLAFGNKVSKKADKPMVACDQIF
jgi:hypothetical protein